MSKKQEMKEIACEKIRSIISEYADSRLHSEMPTPHVAENKRYVFARLDRAALNQVSGGDATISRYALWADTVREYILYALTCFEEGNTSEGKDLIIHAANSLSAFCEIQAIFDPLEVLFKK